MATYCKLSKAKGIEMTVDFLYAGLTRKEILLKFTEVCKVSDKTVDNWIRNARVIVQERLKHDEEVRVRENDKAIEESVKRLNITKERVLEEYAKIAFGDPRNILTVDGGLKETTEWDDATAGAVAGIESFDEKHRETGEVLGTVRKIKLWDKRAALDSICKVLGYNAPIKSSSQMTGPDGGPIQVENTSNVDYSKLSIEVLEQITAARIKAND